MVHVFGFGILVLASVPATDDSLLKEVLNFFVDQIVWPVWLCIKWRKITSCKKQSCKFSFYKKMRDYHFCMIYATKLMEASSALTVGLR